MSIKGGIFFRCKAVDPSAARVCCLAPEKIPPLILTTNAHSDHYDADGEGHDDDNAYLMLSVITLMLMLMLMMLTVMLMMLMVMVIL